VAVKRVVALVPNMVGVAPGQRVRIATWARHLEPYGWTVEFHPFEDPSLHEILYSPGRVSQKVWRLASCYLRQLGRVMGGLPGDVLFIYREAALVGPALLERIAGVRCRLPIVFDLDDPIFLPYRSPSNAWFSLLKFSRKTHALFRLSDRVIAINDLIGQYAARFNPAVTVVPNFVDVAHARPAASRPPGRVRLVWTGSVSTVQNLAAIAAPLRRLQSDLGVAVRVVGVGEAAIPGVEVERREWSAATEVTDLQDADVGLVPLIDLAWNEWKFFLKTVQYMAVGLPVVARAKGSNADVIEDGVNGFLVETEDEWYDRVRRLVEEPELRRRMGEAARRTAVERFSVEAQMPRVAAVFDGAVAQGRRRA